MQREVGAWESTEPEMEYQITHALRDHGQDVRLLGVGDDLQYLIRCLGKWQPDLVFNGAEAFRGNQPFHQLRARHGKRCCQGRNGLRRFHPAHRRCCRGAV